MTNVDRTAQNPNLLAWHDRLWLIDHGAALYFHHAAERDPTHARSPFSAISEHVLLPFAGSSARPTSGSRRRWRELLEDVVAAVPDEWLDGDDRRTYVNYLLERLESPRAFVDEAERARERS